MDDKQLTAITGGGDWSDASVEHLLIPENMHLPDEHLRFLRGGHDHHSFAQWLIENTEAEDGSDHVNDFHTGI